MMHRVMHVAQTPERMMHKLPLALSGSFLWVLLLFEQKNFFDALKAHGFLI